eukprot:CAMPEP_0176479710 /NCGR_PEP_ID=MMETSP0200_2-20121128/1886_1 /TAXON_ID=947934 /ORGANISM="Chaetoceros sp., Strain GSL56" /LENGTH=927 /DNA_ID=CAMNT_0017875775 /DNA_START=12 /DNA_END=2795 /DNA_ORIENTATION=+
MPPLGIFSRGRSPSPGPVEHRQDDDSNIDLSFHGDPDQKQEQSRNSTPLRGIFRGLGSGRHEMNESVHSVNKKLTTPSAKVVDEKAEMEKEYLNIINALSKEQQEARDEIMRRVKETSDLSASKKDLELKVSELEAKCDQLKKKTSRSKATFQDTNKQTRDPKIFTFASKSTDNLEMIKEQLKQHRESNEEMNERVQRLREKYARRRAQADEMSETSSVVSTGTIQTSMSAATTPISLIRHNIVDIKKLQKNYEQEQLRNEELKEAIKLLEGEKNSLESRLKDASTAFDETQRQTTSDIEGLKLQLDAEKSKNEEQEKALDELKKSKDSIKSEKDKEVTSLKMKLTEQSIKIAELQNEINVKEDEIIKLKNNRDGILQEKLQEFQPKLAERETELVKLRNELSSARQQLESVQMGDVTAEDKSNKITTDKHESNESDASDKRIEYTMEDKNQRIQELESDVSKLKSEVADLNRLKSEITSARTEIQKKDEELSALKKEFETSKKNLNELELDFVVVQKKNADTFQQLEDIREKYESQIEKNRKLQVAIDLKTINDAENNAFRLQEAEENLKRLKEEIQQKDKEVASLKALSGKEASLHQQLEGLKLEMASLKLELTNKKEELQNIREEKNKSFSQLETIQQDMLTVQLKSSATFDELEDLKDKYDKEIQEKMSLKEQLEKFSPEEILAEAKKENEAELKQRDSEIHALKKQLTDANVAKTEIELRLMEVMNDVVASQSTRDLMKNELESRLDEENEKAQHLELLIKGKEEGMQRMRKEFEDLRIQMEKETDKRRSEITNLNGEVVEKSSLLSSRERDFVQLKVDMDELKLKHHTEVASLKKQIDEFGANEKEVQRVHRINIDLEREIANLKNEIRRLHMNGNSIDSHMSPQSSVRVLRTRNEELKGQVEKLQRKLRHMKRNVTRIEL